MIKKSTTIIFQDSGETIEDQGGIPLSAGENLVVNGAEYIVSKKSVTCKKAGEDWMAEIEYTLRKAVG